MSAASENLPATVPMPVATSARSSSLTSKVRLGLAVLASLTLLPYAWGFTLVVYSRWGQKDWHYILQLVAGLIGTIALNFHLAAKFPSKRLATWVFGTVFVAWTAIQAAMIAVNNGILLPHWVVFVGCYPATLWVVWTAWMFFTPIRWSIRISVLAVLILLVIPFVTLYRVADLTGDARVNFDFRWNKHDDAAVASSVGELSAGAIKLTAVSPADFPAFQGPARSAVLTDIKLDRDWKEHPPREVWRVPVGAGWGGFAVVGGYAFTQEQRGDDECVVCRDLSNGKEVWVHKDKAPFNGKPRYDGMGGPGPRCTPTVHQGRVYTVGATGILNCLDGGTGHVIWSKNIVTDNGGSVAGHGVCGSPLIVDNAVIVSPTGKPEISLAAYDRLTGKTLWVKGNQPASYATPMLASVGGVEQVLNNTAVGLTAQDPSSGKILWNYDWTNSEGVVCSQPIVDAGAPNQVLLTVGYGKGAVLLKVDHGKDGAWSAQPVWQNNRMKTKFTTAVARDGYVYGLDDGVMQCVDLKTGAQKWKGGRYNHGQILLAGDLIIVQTEPGPVVLIEANPTALKELGRINALSGKTWNCPTLAGKHLLVRNDHEAACYEVGCTLAK